MEVHYSVITSEETTAMPEESAPTIEEKHGRTVEESLSKTTDLTDSASVLIMQASDIELTTQSEPLSYSLEILSDLIV